MHQLVSPFIVTQYQNGNRQGDLTAASLFVDISGFSTLMNTLMEYGQHGAELMAHIMRQIFTPLVECLPDQGMTDFIQVGIHSQDRVRNLLIRHHFGEPVCAK